MKKLLSNETFQISFTLFIIGLFTFFISKAFYINIVLSETIVFFIILILIYFLSRTYAVLQVGLIFIILNSLFWYILSLILS